MHYSQNFESMVRSCKEGLSDSLSPSTSFAHSYEIGATGNLLALGWLRWFTEHLERCYKNGGQTIDQTTKWLASLALDDNLIVLSIFSSSSLAGDDFYPRGKCVVYDLHDLWGRPYMGVLRVWWQEHDMYILHAFRNVKITVSTGAFTWLQSDSHELRSQNYCSLCRLQF